MADQEKDDSRTWQLGKSKQRESGSRFELEEEEKRPSKTRQKLQKKDPAMRESIVSRDRPSSLDEEEEDDRPIVPIGKPIPEKVKLPWTAERVAKHPVTIILGTAIICAMILNTLWPRLRYEQVEDPYAIVYDQEKPGVALLSFFLYSEKHQGLNPYSLGYVESLAVREGRFLMGIGELMITVGTLNKEKLQEPKMFSVDVLKDVPLKPQTDLLLISSQELQTSERSQSVSDLGMKMSEAVKKGQISAEELIALGEQLNWKGKDLLDGFLEDAATRKALGVEGASKEFATKSFPEFASYESKLRVFLHHEFVDGLIAVHGRYY